MSFEMPNSAMRAGTAGSSMAAIILKSPTKRACVMNEPAKKGLPRIHLIVSAGTLPSVGKNRMDLLRYRESGIPRLTGEQLLEPLPEAAAIARLTVEAGPPPDNTSCLKERNHD